MASHCEDKATAENDDRGAALSVSGEAADNDVGGAASATAAAATEWDASTWGVGLWDCEDDEAMDEAEEEDEKPVNGEAEVEVANWDSTEDINEDDAPEDADEEGDELEGSDASEGEEEDNERGTGGDGACGSLVVLVREMAEGVETVGAAVALVDKGFTR